LLDAFISANSDYTNVAKMSIFKTIISKIRRQLICLKTNDKKIQQNTPNKHMYNVSMYFLYEPVDRVKLKPCCSWISSMLWCCL